jgi:hypothetical protein
MRIIQFAIVILGIIFSTPSSSCPIINFTDYLTSIPDGVMVSYEATNIIFDDSGNFVQEFSMDPSSRIIGMSHDGRLWSLRTEDEHTIVSSHTGSGSIIKEYEFQGSWAAEISGDSFYVAPNENSQKLQIDIFNPQSDTLEHYATIVAPSQIDRWAVGPSLICSSGWSDPVSVVACFTHDGTQQWTNEYYGDPLMSAYVEIDAHDNVYVIGATTENRRPAILQFDRYGSMQKEIPSKNGIYAFAISDRGSLFVADRDQLVHHYSSNGKLIESWDAAPLVGNETWPDRRNNERIADSVNEFSNTDDLIVAALNGKPAQRIKAANWLFSRGPQIIPRIMQQCFSGGGFTDDLLDRAIKEMRNESFSEIARRFPKATEFEKEKVASRLIDAERFDVPGLLEFVEYKIQNTNYYDRFEYESLLVKMGKGRRVLEEKWQQVQDGEADEDDLAIILSFNFSDASEVLEPSVLNSSDRWSSLARKIMIDALAWSLNNDVSSKPSDIERYENWIRSGNPDLIPLATVYSLKAGNIKQLNNAIQFAINDRSLAPIVLDTTIDAMIRNPELKSAYASQIHELAKKLVFSKGDYLQEFVEQDVFRKMMQFPEFRDIAVSDALHSFESTAKNQEFIISNYLGPQLVSREVVSEFLAAPISTDPEYWKYVDLIATRFISDPFVKQQIRSLMLSQISRNSPYDSNALKILSKVGELDDSEVISNLVRHGSDPCEACTFHEGLKTLGSIGVNAQAVSNILPYLEIEPVITAAALSRAAFPSALPILLDEAGATSSYHPIELSGAMFIPYGNESEDGLLSKLKSTKNQGREEILILLAEIGSKAGYEIVRKEFDDALKEEEFPPDSSIAALMISGKDPWSELLEYLSVTEDNCDEYFLRSFPSRFKLQAATHIAQLMLNENDAARFKLLRCWLYKMDENEEIEHLIEWVDLNHPNPKMRELLRGF